MVWITVASLSAGDHSSGDRDVAGTSSPCFGDIGGWAGVQAALLGELPLQLVFHVPATAEEPIHRRILLPRKTATPLLHETLAWHGFQLE